MATDDQIRSLEKKVEELAHQVGKLQDTQAVRDLQYKYGYYLDKCLYDEVVDLFTDDCEVHFIGGIFRGKASARRLYCDRFRKNFTGGHNGPGARLPAGSHDAAGHHRHLARRQNSLSPACVSSCRLDAITNSPTKLIPLRQWWEGSLYENVYAKENGIWKMKVLNYRPVYHADFDKGWAFTKPNYVPFYTDTYPGESYRSR